MSKYKAKTTASLDIPFIEWDGVGTTSMDVIAAELNRLAGELETAKERYGMLKVDCDAIETRAIKAEASLAEAVGALRRYRQETPPGHQPHMLAHKVDAILAKHAGGGQ